MNEKPQSAEAAVDTVGVGGGSGRLTRADVQERLRQVPTEQPRKEEATGSGAPASDTSLRLNRRKVVSPLFLVGCFAVLNVVMYFSIHKFWIGGSSFLPMIGILGEGNKFLFAFLVNVGVIMGSFLGAYTSGEFRLRLPRKREIPKAIVGGILIGMGVTVAPGTCTTAFVTGMPMLSVSSFLSAAGIFIGAHIVYSFTLGRR